MCLPFSNMISDIVLAKTAASTPTTTVTMSVRNQGQLLISYNWFSLYILNETVFSIFQYDYRGDSSDEDDEDDEFTVPRPPMKKKITK